MPTTNIRKWSGTAMLRETSMAAGVGYDTDDSLIKILGDGTVRPVGFGVSPGVTYCVDGTAGVGSDSNHGKSWSQPKATIQAAVTAASARDTILIRAKTVAAAGTDPSSYAETIIIPATHFGLRLIGVGHGPTQGGVPQIKIGAGSTALLTVRAAGCLTQGLGFNGVDSTGGGILLDSDGSTKDAFGAVIRGCHFKNCQGATNAASGGAIQWPAYGGSWQVRIEGNRFYQCRGGIIGKGTGGAVLQDIAIVENEFLASVNTNVDCDIYFAPDGCVSLNIIGNKFMCPNVPEYASTPTAARYVLLTGSTGALIGNHFACAAAKTFGVAGDGGIIPTTVYMEDNYDEGGLIARA